MAEEPAWRGFAVPRMQATRNPLTTAVILGMLVALWHLPLVGDVGLIGLPATFSITIVYVWLFNRTGGSVLLTLLFHNAQGFIRMGDLGYSGADLSRQEWLEFVAWSLIALVLIVFDRAAWRTAPASAVYPERDTR
jgi:membrane protease YdiL (CAAX protease family)